MSKESCTKKPLALAIGSAFAATLAVAPSANAADNPFGMTELSGGYMQVASEGRCGGMKSGSEGKCGEGKCGGGSMKSGSEGKCGGDMKSKSEGKCGEGKCGGRK